MKRRGLESYYWKEKKDYEASIVEQGMILKWEFVMKRTQHGSGLELVTNESKNICKVDTGIIVHASVFPALATEKCLPDFDYRWFS